GRRTWASNDVHCSDGCAPIVLQLLIYGLTNGAIVALNAVGFTLAYAVARQINLAHGNVFTVVTVLVASLAGGLGLTEASPFPLRLAALVVLAGCGAAGGAILNAGVERLAFHPFRDRRDPLAPLIASAALSFLLLGVAVWWHAATTVPKPYHQGVNL